MTPEFGAASQLEKIDMLDFADTVAINKFERRGAKDALRDVGRQLVRNREAFGKQPRRDAGLRHQRRHLQRRRRHRALPAPARHPRRRKGCRSPRARSRTSTCATRRASARSCRPSGCATSPRSPRPSAATTRRPSAYAEGRAPRAAPRHRAGELVDAGEDADGVEDLLETARKDAPARGLRPDRRLAGGRGVLLRRRAGVDGPRQGDPHQADPRVAVRQQDPARLAAPVHRPRRAGEVLAQREPARLLPLHRRRLPVQARRRGPGPDVRRRGRPVRTNRRFKMLSQRRRGDPPLDRVRLGDPLRPRPRPAPRRLRQGRHLRRLGRHARGHEGALRRLRPDRALDLGVDDDQRPGPDRARLLPQHRDRPAGRQFRERRAASPTPPSAASSAAYALEQVRGTVQADILKEDQGQNTCLFSTEFCCG